MNNACDLCGDQPQNLTMLSRCHLTAPLKAELPEPQGIRGARELMEAYARLFLSEKAGS